MSAEKKEVAVGTGVCVRSILIFYPSELHIHAATDSIRWLQTDRAVFQIIHDPFLHLLWTLVG